MAEAADLVAEGTMRHVRSAAMKWRSFHRTKHKSKLDRKISYRQFEKKQLEKSKLQLSMDLLAKEWLDSQFFDLDSRVYLLDKLLPSLILGLEKLLIEVGKRPPEKHFNPINYLAQYLMRNNLRYCNFPEASSPYVRGLRKVCEELRQTMLNQDKLAAMKASLQQRREEAAEMERKQEELERRKGVIIEQCTNWGETEEVLSLEPVCKMLKSYNDKHFAEGLSPASIEETGEPFFNTQDQFVSYVWDYAKELTIDEQFSAFVRHMESCIEENKRNMLKNTVWSLLAEIFDHCDGLAGEKTGLLDRPRVLLLLANYYDSLVADVKHQFLNPRHWPLAEIPEVEEEEQWQEERRLSSSEGMSTPVTDSRPDTRVLCISRARELSGMRKWPVVTPTGPGQSWDHEYLSKEQFTQLLKLFLCDNDTVESAEQLSEYVKENFAETDEELSARIKQAQLRQQTAYKWNRLGNLFSHWDVNCSGQLSMKSVQEVLKRQTEFTGSEEVELDELSADELNRTLTREQFCDYIDQLVSHESIEFFDTFVDFMCFAVKMTLAEEQRSKQRQQWLEEIADIGKTSGLSMLPCYNTACAIIEQDCKTYGGNKAISAYIGEHSASKGLLEFVASSSRCQGLVVGQTLHKKHRQVSFQAVDSGLQLHISGVQILSDIYFFSEQIRLNPEGYAGSLVVSPIFSSHCGVVGTLNVDSLTYIEEASHSDTSFAAHERQFYMGVCVQLGELFDVVNSRRKLVYIVHSCFCWLRRRCGSVLQNYGLYIVEPIPPAKLQKYKRKDDSDTFVLRNPLYIAKGTEKPNMECPRMFLRDYLFSRYLYQCVQTSGTTMCEAYGATHWAYPVRDRTGCAVAVVDLGVQRGIKLSYAQNREVMRIMKLLSMAYHQLLELREIPQSEVDLLFDQVMLSELRGTLEVLDARVFAELRSYVEPPPIVNLITKAILAIFEPEKCSEEWTNYKNIFNSDFVKRVKEYDPLHVDDPCACFSRLSEAMEPIASDSVLKDGSLPALHLYNWLCVCLSLLEHSSRMASNQ